MYITKISKVIQSFQDKFQNDKLITEMCNNFSIWDNDKNMPSDIHIRLLVFLQ